jgi:uncharacterized protein (TIGR02117 family)
MRTIHLVARDWHTGFVMPAKEICKLLPELRQRFGDVAFLEFGWGDRCYYQRESSSLMAKLLAVLIPSASTLQVVAITDSPQKFYRAEPIEALLLEDSGFEALVQFIANSFAINQQAGLIMQCYGRTGDSQFYQARGLYHLFNTCNTWSAIGLSKAGVKIKPRFIFTAESIMAAASKGQKPYSNCR